MIRHHIGMLAQRKNPAMRTNLSRHQDRGDTMDSDEFDGPRKRGQVACFMI